MNLSRHVKPKVNGSHSKVLEGDPNLESNARIMSELRVASALIDRLSLASRSGVRFDDKRKLYDIFGYKVKLTSQDFLAKYARQDITSRIVDAPPDAIWSNPPEIEGNEPLKTAWEELTRKYRIWNVVHRADRLARLGRFSTILIGLDDGGNLESAVRSGQRELIYLRPLGETQVQIPRFITNTSDPRFGKPEIYQVDFEDPNSTGPTEELYRTTKDVNSLRIHWTRMLHIVENPLEDETFSTPILAKVFNILDDLLKTAGGTAETYWLTANRGIQADVDKEMELNPEDAAALADELDEYMHQLRRVLRTRGVKLNVLGSDVPDPKNVVDMMMGIISGTTGIPKRILLGSEAGQLASEQDRANWAERIGERRKMFAEPYVLDPLITRFQEIGILPEGDYEYKWPEAFKVSPLERSQTMAAQARAVGNLSRQVGNNIPMQLTSREEARDIIGLEGDLEESELMPQADAEAMLEREDEQRREREEAIDNRDDDETRRPDESRQQPPAQQR